MPVTGESIPIVGFLVEFDVDDDEPDPNCCSLGSRVSQLATITTPAASAARRMRFDRMEYYSVAGIKDGWSLATRAGPAARRR